MFSPNIAVVPTCPSLPQGAQGFSGYGVVIVPNETASKERQGPFSTQDESLWGRDKYAEVSGL